MGILSHLFGSAPAAATEDVCDPNFVTAEWVLRRAFDRVAASIDVGPEKREALLVAYLSGHRSANTRATNRTIALVLVGSGWRWRDFETWRARFAVAGEWPYMWQSLSELSSPPPVPPKTSYEAVALLKVADMRALARERGLMPMPAPRKRAEFAALLAARAPLACLLERAREGHEAAADNFRHRYELAKCELLVHTLDMTAYAIRDAEQRKRAGFRFTLQALANAGCPIEDRFAAQFNAGSITELPPYFPGDRTAILTRLEGPSER